MARMVVRSMSPMAMHRTETLGMSPRQQQLNFLWSWYATVRYDTRKVEWDGSESVDKVDAEAICQAGVLPGGFYDAGVEFPLRFRKPTSPYNLPRVIVNRFTSLLFSERTHPKVTCPVSEQVDDYISGLVEATRLWSKFGVARTFGGATGTFCIGFKFIDGKPIIEVHDPRWVTPLFKDKELLELEALDKRWMWPEHVLNEDGEYTEVWYWSRRIINADFDVVWNKVPVGDGREPDWNAHDPDQAIEHKLGECPVVWGQNVPVVDSEDGEPDCLGVFDMVEEMDALLSQSGTSIKQNMDPTVVINSDMKLRDLQKGSDNAIKLEKGGGAMYMEGNFEGSKEGRAQAMQLRELVLEVAQCVLEQEDANAPETATKTRERRSSMEARVDVLREQYGQQGILPLIYKMLRAIKKMSAQSVNEEGIVERGEIKIPPRVVVGKDGQKTVKERILPDDVEPVLGIEWPPQRRPTPEEISSMATAVSGMKTNGVVSLERAVHMLAPFTGVEDPQAEIDLINSEAKEREAEAQAKAAAAWGR